MTTLTFSPALDRIAAVQLGLSISSPLAQTIKRTYRVPPKQGDALPDVPCFINTVDLPDIHWLPNSQRQRRFVVGMQLFVKDADNDQGREIALSFLEAIVVAFHADVTLNGTCTAQTLRGGTPTLARLDWAGQSFVGLQLFMDVFIYDEGIAGP